MNFWQIYYLSDKDMFESTYSKVYKLHIHVLYEFVYTRGRHTQYQDEINLRVGLQLKRVKEIFVVT